MNKMLAITLCCTVMFAIVSCHSSKTDEVVQMPNPVISYETAQDALAVVAFDATLISNIPKDYEFDSASVIDNTLVQIDFIKGDSKIRYRTAKTTDDITGVYIDFPDEDVITINNTDITIVSTGKQINIAKWNVAGIAFSLSFTYNEGAMLDKDAIIEMILSVL